MSDSPGAGPSSSRNTPGPLDFASRSNPASSSSSRVPSPFSARKHTPSPLLDVPRTSTPAAAGVGGDPGSAPATPLSATSNASASSSGSKTKRRPRPLILNSLAREVGQDEERSAQLEMDGLGTARSGITITTGDSGDEPEGAHDDGKSNLSDEINNLSLLRRDVQANLRERPLDSPLSQATTDTDDRSPTASSDHSFPPLAESDYVPLSAIQLPSDRATAAHHDGRHVVVDIRPLGAYLASHLPGSVHLAIPSLLYKRYRRYGGQQPTTPSRLDAQAISSYITPKSDRTVVEEMLRREEVHVVVLGSSDEEAVHVYKAVLSGAARGERVKILRGGWTAVLRDEAVLATVQPGPTGQSGIQTGGDRDAGTAGRLSIGEIDKAYPPPKSAPLRSSIPTFNIDIAPPPVPHTNQDQDPDRPLPHKQSMPSLRSGPGLRRKVPALSIQTAQPQLSATGGRPPKLSLNLDRPARSNTTGQYPDLRLNVPSPIAGSYSSAGSGAGPAKSPARGTFQPDGAGVGSSLFSTETRQTPIPTMSDSASPTATWPDRDRDRERDSEPPQTASLPTARNAIAPFIVSTILPSFLYLGPEITSQAEIKALKDLGVKRILNVALECEDDQGLGLDGAFDKYTKIPMRDIVEETGVSGYMREACDLLDDARLHSAPVYVHCKAGKSRSVTVVLAYLIHANAWTLKTAYAYVAERRRGISPNIGFVAELMQFEEIELGIKQSSGVHGEVPQPRPKSKGDDNGGRTNPARGSLPPAWVTGPASSLDTRPPERLPLPSGTETGTGGQANGESEGKEEKARTVRDEREVMKNGQWVQQRRAPVDRMTLQPGRRASKAGLESLRTDSAGAETGTIISDVEVDHSEVDLDLDRKAAVTSASPAV